MGAGWGIFGACLQCSAQNHVWMIFGMNPIVSWWPRSLLTVYKARLINGIGTGILNAIVPVWATETAEHTSRGQFVSIEFTLNILGVVVAYWLEFACSYYGNGSGYYGFAVFEVRPVPTQAKRKPNIKISSTLPNWSAKRPRATLTSPCFSALAKANFILLVVCSSSFGSKSCRNGLVSLV